MPIPAQHAAFWARFARTHGAPVDDRFHEAFAFGDSAAMADDLAALVLQGTKRATASALWTYEAEGQPMPQPGGLSIVTDAADRALCVIETRSVEVVPFREVTAEFAATEGEGDGSLAYWRRVHEDFFTRECVAAGRAFSDTMPIVCECFEVVYRPSAP